MWLLVEASVLTPYDLSLSIYECKNNCSETFTGFPYLCLGFSSEKCLLSLELDSFSLIKRFFGELLEILSL